MTGDELYSAAELVDFVVRCLIASDVSPGDASVVAEVLIAADLGGSESHGVARLPRYVNGILSGSIVARDVALEVSRSGSTAVIDVANGLGQPAARKATSLAVELAELYGSSSVALRRSNHFGIAGYYARLGAKAGMLTFVLTNSTAQVAPTDGATRVLGTNPIAIGVPTDRHEPFVFDAATSVAPRGRLERMAAQGAYQIPEGWAVDRDGAPATEIQSILSGLRRDGGHALLPIGGSGETHGGHKGFGLGLVVDLMCGPLSGAAWGTHLYERGEANLGHFIICVDVKRLISMSEFRRMANTLLDEIRYSRPSRVGGAVRVAGDGEIAIRRTRLVDGIPISSDVVAQFEGLAEILAVAAPRSLAQYRERGEELS